MVQLDIGKLIIRILCVKFSNCEILIYGGWEARARLSVWQIDWLIVWVSLSDSPVYSYRFGRVVVLATTGGVAEARAHPVMVGQPMTRRSGGRASD